MLSGRNEKILRAIVQTYIGLPDPVGSRLIAKKYNFNLSSATIRNAMADLEEMGYLSQPHTSAGRIPTDKAFRFYVDTIEETEDYEEEDLSVVLRNRFDAIKNDLNALLEETTKTLSTITHNLVFAIPLKYESTTLNRVQLFIYRGNRVATMVITNEGLIKTRVIDNDFGLSQRELNRISDYINSEFSGKSIGAIRLDMVRQISRERALYDVLISRAISICSEAMCLPTGEVIMSGFSELIKLPEISDRINEIAGAIEDKQRIVKLLDGLAASSVGVQVVIGEENPIEEMKMLSIVMAPYKQGDVTAGTVGVIGPTRMDYLKAMHMVGSVARFISLAVSK